MCCLDKTLAFVFAIRTTDGRIVTRGPACRRGRASDPTTTLAPLAPPSACFPRNRRAAEQNRKAEPPLAAVDPCLPFPIQNPSKSPSTGALPDGRELAGALPTRGAGPPAPHPAAHPPRRARAAPPRPGRPRRLREPRVGWIARDQAVPGAGGRRGRGADLRAVVGRLGHRFPHSLPSPQGTCLRLRSP